MNRFTIMNPQNQQTEQARKIKTSSKNEHNEAQIILVPSTCDNESQENL